MIIKVKSEKWKSDILNPECIVWRKKDDNKSEKWKVKSDILNPECIVWRKKDAGGRAYCNDFQIFIEKIIVNNTDIAGFIFFS